MESAFFDVTYLTANRNNMKIRKAILLTSLAMAVAGSGNATADSFTIDYNNSSYSSYPENLLPVNLNFNFYYGSTWGDYAIGGDYSSVSLYPDTGLEIWTSATSFNTPYDPEYMALGLNSPAGIGSGLTGGVWATTCDLAYTDYAGTFSNPVNQTMGNFLDATAESPKYVAFRYTLDGGVSYTYGYIAGWSDPTAVNPTQLNDGETTYAAQSANFNVLEIATITPAPEPSTLALSTLGGLALLLKFRRRK